MNNEISHDGVVVKVDGRRVSVQFVQSSACSGCHAKHLCTSGESKQRVIEADSYGMPYAVGDEVVVSVTQRLARTAMIFAFGLPVVIVMASIFPLIAWVGEMGACLGIALLLTVYYVVFYLNRKKLDRKVEFSLSRRTR